VIVSEWSWRGIFLVNVPIGVVAVAVTAWRVEESRSPHPTPPDWAGFVTLTAGLVSLIYGLIRAGERSWSDVGVIICLALAVAFLGSFIFTERRTAHPMFDLSLLRVPTFSGGAIAAFTMNGSLYALLLYLVIYLQDILGYSALGAGLRIAVLSGATFVSSALAGRFSQRVPARWLIGPGLALVGVGLFLMAGLTGSWTHFIPGFIVSGLGAGMVNPPLASTAIGVVRPEKAGMASGVNNTFRQVGMATGIAAFGSVFRTHGLNDLFWIAGAIALAGSVCAFTLIRSRDFLHHAPAGAGAAPSGAAPAAAASPVAATTPTPPATPAPSQKSRTSHQ
jgi:predicted MFS family arabinose efflux permease